MLSSTFWHVLAENILLVALGQTIAICEAKMLCLKANLLGAKALFQKAALLDWSAPGLIRICRPGKLGYNTVSTLKRETVSSNLVICKTILSFNQDF